MHVDQQVGFCQLQFSGFRIQVGGVGAYIHHIGNEHVVRAEGNDFRLAGQSDSGHDAGVAAPQIQGAGIRWYYVKTKILTTGLFSATSNFHQFGSGTMGLRP